MQSHGIRRFRVDLHLEEHGDAHDDGPNADRKIGPKHRNLSRIIGNKAEEIEDIGRIRPRKILDPAEKWRLPHLDGDDEHLIESEEYGNLDQYGHAAR